MRKLIVGLGLAGMVAGGFGFAHATPGPFGPNNWGLCNAYAHNNEHAHKAPPFAALEAAAEAQNQTVEEWCADNGQQPGNRHNG